MKYIIANIEVSSAYLKSFTTRWQFKVSDESEVQTMVEKHFPKLLGLKEMKLLKCEVISISDIENFEYNTISLNGPKIKHQI